MKSFYEFVKKMYNEVAPVPAAPGQPVAAPTTQQPVQQMPQQQQKPVDITKKITDGIARDRSLSNVFSGLHPEIQKKFLNTIGSIITGS